MRSSTSSGSLVPPMAKNLMPLSGAGLCDAEIMTPKSASIVGDQEGGRRSRDHAGVEHVDARARETRRDRGGEELAGDARVACDDGDGADGPSTRQLVGVPARA